MFGSTPSGSDWCVKALHPSDPMCEVRGVPDESSFPSVMMNYQSTFVLGAKAGATGTWSFDAQLTPHPVNLMSFLRVCDNGNDTGSFLNGQLDAVTATHYDKYVSLNHFAKRWRLAYMSVTMYQDGPDLANQGTVVACQRPVQMKRYAISSISPSNASWQCSPDVTYLMANDLPNYEVSQNMPNAYFNRSKEGVYLPLKLSPDSRRWRSVADDIRYTVGATINDHSISLTPSLVEVGTGYPFGDSYIDNVAVANTALRETQAVQVAGSLNGALFGEQTHGFLNDIWGDISVRNIAVATSVSFFVRMGLEIQVAPASELSPHQKLSPPLDRMALDSYTAIARELKDAYPADYNDLGKIWNAISTAAKTVAPFLNFIPEIGPVLSMGIEGAAAAGDLVKKIASKGPRKLDPANATIHVESLRNPQPAAAAVERAQERRAANATLQAAAASKKIQYRSNDQNRTSSSSKRQGKGGSTPGKKKKKKNKKGGKPKAIQALNATEAALRALLKK